MVIQGRVTPGRRHLRVISISVYAWFLNVGSCFLFLSFRRNFPYVEPQGIKKKQVEEGSYKTSTADANLVVKTQSSVCVCIFMCMWIVQSLRVYRTW